MIRSNVVLNQEGLLHRIESFNQYSLNSNIECLDLYADVAKNMNSIIEYIENDHHDRQVISLFAKNIKTSFSLLADGINHYVNNYFFSMPEISTAIFSHLTQSNFFKTSRALVNLKYVSPFFNDIASHVINESLKNQTELVRPYNYGLRTASETIAFVKNHNFTKIDLWMINFTDEEFIELAKNCPNLTAVALPSRLTDKGIIGFVKNCQKLTEINSSCITDESLKEIARNCPLLKKINLRDSTITDEGLIEFAKGHPLLEAIVISNTDVTDRGLLEIAKNCPHLIKFECQETAISRVGADKIIENCTFLTKINLSYTQVDGNVIIELLKNRSNLAKLKLSETRVSAESFEMIKKNFPNLTELFLSDYAITYNQLVNLATACPKLTKYHFNLDLMSEDEHLNFIDDFPHCEWSG